MIRKPKSSICAALDIDGAPAKRITGIRQKKAMRKKRKVWVNSKKRKERG
jgi:hypothetical protein